MLKTKSNFFIIILIAVTISLFIFYSNNDVRYDNEMLNFDNLIKYASDTINMTNEYLIGKDKFTNTNDDDDNNGNDDELILNLLEAQTEHKKNSAIGVNEIIGINNNVNSMKNRVNHLNSVLENNIKMMRNKKLNSELLYNTNGELTRNDN